MGSLRTVLRCGVARRHPVTADDERCAAELPEPPTPAQEAVECPECGGPIAPRQIATWGHGRPCRTADSRSIQPLRW
ncbi:hypothetical protein A6V29_02945 [Blastococcus sp. CCUG 61487]|nr:hypothetical protein A6V29_02945 [Blastococcus sp. CCUG 61487]